MLEIFSNTLQYLVASVCVIYSVLQSIRLKSQHFFMLTCFYITFALGLFYWLFYLIKNTYTPQYFYVSDLSWIASVLFLLILCISIASPDEKRYQPAAAWVAVAIFSVLTIYMLQWGDILFTLIWDGLTIACGYFATRGWLYARQHPDGDLGKQSFYLAVFAFVFCEFGLWTSSCLFSEVKWTNPSIWFDFGLTSSLVALVVTGKKMIKT